MDSESYHNQEYFNCCLNCTFYWKVNNKEMCGTERKDLKPCHSLNICKDYKRLGMGIK